MTHSKLCPVCNAEYPTDTRFCPVDASPLRLIVDGADLSGRMLASRYELLSKIGEGGMGEVYLAEQITIGRRCAIKVMKPALVDDRDAISRFAREASNASRINHTNVAAVYDFGESEGLLFLVMEYVPGDALSAVLRAGEPLPVSRVLGISLQIADALAVAHDAGVIHRDLKPDNIMLCATPHGGELAKVVDFGIAKGMSGCGQTITGTGLVVGTPGYMSPEQLVGDPIDGRSDLYSLACVMYKALVGESPFGTTAEEQIARRLIEPPPSARSRNPLVPPAVDAVILRTLQRDPAQRFQNAREFRAALVAAWTASTVLAPPTPTSPWPPPAFSATEILGHGAIAAPSPVPVDSSAVTGAARQRVSRRGRAVAACATALVLGGTIWSGVVASRHADAQRKSTINLPPLLDATPPPCRSPQGAKQGPTDEAKQTGSPSVTALGATKELADASSRGATRRPIASVSPNAVSTIAAPSSQDSPPPRTAEHPTVDAPIAADGERVRDSIARFRRDDSVRVAMSAEPSRSADSAQAVSADERGRDHTPADELSAYVRAFVDGINRSDAAPMKAASSLTNERDVLATIVRERHPTATTTAVDEVIVDGESAHRDFTARITYRGNFGTSQTTTAQFRAWVKRTSSSTWARDGIELLHRR